MRLSSLFFLFLFQFGLMASVSAKENANVACSGRACFELVKQIGAKKLALKGSGLLEYWMFDLYSAAFYAPSNIRDSKEALEDVPKSLVIEYHRSIDRDKIIKAANDILKKNPEVNLKEIEPKVKQIGQAYQDVQKGDRYELRYDPAKGTSLFFNDQHQVTIAGNEFAKAYFGIWVSEYAGSKKLRNKLLSLGSAS